MYEHITSITALILSIMPKVPEGLEGYEDEIGLLSHHSAFILIRLCSQKQSYFSSLFTLFRFQTETDIYQVAFTFVLKNASA